MRVMRGSVSLSELPEVPLPPRPVLLMHAALEGASDLENLRGWIAAARPGAEVFNLQVFEGIDSLNALSKQVSGLAKKIRALAQDRESFAHGYDLVCHSQGALLCRVLCEVMDDHQVHTLVSLAGPQMGVYGGTWLEHLEPLLIGKLPVPVPLPSLPFVPPIPVLSTSYRSFYKLAYTPVVQKSLAAGGLWNDPLHRRAYLQGNTFLPEVNGELGASHAERLKANFLRLRKAVFLTGRFPERQFDSKEGLEPWQSGVFGYYAVGSDSKILPMERQQVFTEDTFGLRTLNLTGRLHVEAVDGVEHQAWVSSRSVFEKHVLPHLQI